MPTLRKKRSITRRLLIPKTRSSARSSGSDTNKRCGKRNMMDETERKALIESDSWAGQVTAISVECKGCGKTVSLDKRSMYYPGLWIKHRSKCPGIRRLESTMEKPDVSVRPIFQTRTNKKKKITGRPTREAAQKIEEICAARAGSLIRVGISFQRRRV